jgi:hypothetical protein
MARKFEQVAAAGDIEASVRERQGVGIALQEAEVGLGELRCAGELVGRLLHAPHLPCGDEGGDTPGEVAQAAADVEDRGGGSDLEEADEGFVGEVAQGDQAGLLLGAGAVDVDGVGHSLSSSLASGRHL